MYVRMCACAAFESSSAVRPLSKHSFLLYYSRTDRCHPIAVVNLYLSNLRLNASLHLALATTTTAATIKTWKQSQPSKLVSTMTNRFRWTCISSEWHKCRVLMLLLLLKQQSATNSSHFTGISCTTNSLLRPPDCATHKHHKHHFTHGHRSPVGNNCIVWERESKNSDYIE